MRQRSTTIMIDTTAIPDNETAQETIRESFRPWLDELEKDGLEYQDLAFYVEDGLDEEHPYVMAITATVMTQPKEKRGE